MVVRPHSTFHRLRVSRRSIINAGVMCKYHGLYIDIMSSVLGVRTNKPISHEEAFLLSSRDKNDIKLRFGQ